jgi:hypothetical protein
VSDNCTTPSHFCQLINLREQVGSALALSKIQAAQHDSSCSCVHVGVNESWRHQRTTKINYAIGELGVHGGTCIITDPGNDAVVDKQCSGEWIAR